MKNLKNNLFGIGLTLSVILGVAFAFMLQEANAHQRLREADGVRINCYCTGLGGECKVHYSPAHCAQSEDGGNIHCGDFHDNC